MLIALDYDETYTKDPDFWLAFIELSQKHGHQIVVATMRTLDEKAEMCDRLHAAVPWIVPTHRMAKKRFLATFDIHPDIWIDDNPAFILTDASS